MTGPRLVSEASREVTDAEIDARQDRKVRVRLNGHWKRTLTQVHKLISQSLHLTAGNLPHRDLTGALHTIP